MSRSTAVTVCVVTGDDRRATRQFLSRLAEALGPHDNVLVTGAGRPPASEAAAWRVLAAGRELRRVPGDAPPKPRPIVLLVEDRVEPVEGWVDILAEALERSGAGAVAPRTNVADGDELYVGVPYRPDEHSPKRAFARDLAATERGCFTDARALAGPCIAVRRESLEELGGLAGALAHGYDPAALATAVAGAGKRLVVAEGCYLHHPGGATRRPDPSAAGLPLVTACLIVRDEEDNLPRCLASTAGFADEIVVYDTGSVDGTIRIAEEAGATVVRGYWDDDFSRARNAALESCRGQWILWLDADEALACDDPAGLRSSLAGLTSDLESYIVLIDNLVGNEAGSTFTHPACRLFRRAYGHWEGHLHEQVHARAGRSALTRQLLDTARISHRGYLQSQVDGRSKGDRNLRTAFGDLVSDSGLDWSTRLLSLGRSYAMAGRNEESLEHCRKVVEIAKDPWELRLARRAVLDSLLALGRPDEVLEGLDDLRSISASSTLADIYEGHAHLARQEHEEALAAFERVRPMIDEDGFEYTTALVAGPKSLALHELGRHGDAADVLLASIADTGGVDAHLGRLVESLELAGRDALEVYDTLGPERLKAFVPQLLQLQPERADRVLESWYGRDADSQWILAAAAQVATRLGISRQLLWSSRLRAAGFPGACPLVASAADESTEPRDRVLAAAAGAVMFSDRRARQVFGAAVLSAPPALRDDLAAEVAAIAPQLAEAFAALGATAERPTRHPGTGTRGPERRVLLVDRERSTLRTAAVAMLLAEAGHEVTLVQPMPASSSIELLGPLGISVRGWDSTGPEASSWRKSCETALAYCTAEQPYDVAVVSASAVDALPALRRLLPTASIAVDLDLASSVNLPAGRLDLLLSASGPDASGTVPVAYVAPTPRVLPARPPIPPALRSGLCIVGNLRCATPATVERLVATLAPLLRSACADTSIALCGDDPGHELARAFPDAITVGAIADPSPWVASSRAVLVAHPDAAVHWLAAAAASGTPALVVPEDPGRVAEVVADLAALLADDAPSQQLAPSGAAPDQSTDDPLAGLPAPWVRPSRRAPLGSRPGGDGRPEVRPGGDGRPEVRPGGDGRPEVRPGGDGRPEVRIAGNVYGFESLAQMNRELATALACDDGPFDVSVVTPEEEPFPEDSVRALAGVRVLASPALLPADLEIRQQWPPDFTPAAGGRVVSMLPWEWGGLPAEWIAPIRDVVDEIWAPTSWVRDCIVRSGLPEHRVQVVPYGVDVARFRPEGRPYPLRTKKGTKLLFVGGLIERKGVDALLECYLSAFGRDDDVCLVVKPFGSDSVYRNANLDRDVRQAAAGDGPEIEIVDGELSFEDIAALYRSCDALVHPYRGEGFGMTIAEAMASGIPVIVPDGGACLDFCDESNAWLVRAREVPMTLPELTASNAGSWWLEPSRRELAAAMHAAVADPATGKQKGAEGRQRIAGQFTWDVVAERATERIEALLGGSADEPASPAMSTHTTRRSVGGAPVDESDGAS